MADISRNATEITNDAELVNIKPFNEGVLSTESYDENSSYRGLDKRDYRILNKNIENVSTTNSSTPNLKVFGNDLKVKNPSKIGNVHSYLFINGQPLITLGPQCNIITI